MNLIRLGDRTPTLSILVCSIFTRQTYVTRLLDQLTTQIGRVPGAEVVVATDDGEHSIGEKRNLLLREARGGWLCFVDDDDTVADDYVATLLQALASDPDTVGFRVRRTVDGALDGEAIHSLRFTENRNTQLDGRNHYERMPNHLNPIRASIARAVGFKPLDSGEDTDYATRARELLHREEYIDRVLYRYDYRSPDARADENVHATDTSSVVGWFATHARKAFEVDAVIIADSRTPTLLETTATTIRTLQQTTPGVNVIVVESARGVDWPGCTVVRPIGPFNYNGYLMQGMRHGSAPWVALLNNDLVFFPGWWKTLMAAAESSALESVSPRCPRDHRQSRLARHGVVKGYDVGRHVSGWAIVCKRDLLSRIGGLDDGPHFWFSDDAYAAQLAARHIEHGLVTNALVLHRGSRTLKELPSTEQDRFKVDPSGRFKRRLPDQAVA